VNHMMTTKAFTRNFISFQVYWETFSTEQSGCSKAFDA